MERRRLGRSGLSVSCVCLGCWQAGGVGWGEVSDQEIEKAIKIAINELDINFVDTADVYGYGHSEEVVGKALKGLRDKVILATKVGLRWNGKQKSWNDLSRNYILKQIDESLTRLQTEYVDLYQAHWPDSKTSIEELTDAFETLCEKGKIRWWGVSNFSVEMISKIIDLGAKHFTSVQPPYNLLERSIEKDILPFCRKNNISVIVYSPLAMGLLTGKYKEEPKFEGFDWRNLYEYFRGKKFKDALEGIEKITPFKDKYNATYSQIAISWILKTDGITSAIVGFKNENQIRETSKIIQIEDEDYKLIAEAFSKK